MNEAVVIGIASGPTLGISGVALWVSGDAYPVIAQAADSAGNVATRPTVNFNF